jgi:hypothetical protein
MGIDNSNSTLTKEKVIYICNVLSSGSVDLTKFAKYIKVDEKDVLNIYKKNTWKDITENFEFKKIKTKKEG